MKKIKNLEYYIKNGYETGFRVSYPYACVSEDTKNYLLLNTGEYKIPPYHSKHRIVIENIYGALKIRKDLPKISKTIYVKRYNPRFIEYNYERDVYQRIYGNPLNLKIGIEMDDDGNLHICSPILSNNTPDDEILMYLNLFKDLFGKFNICNPVFKDIIKMDLKKDWDILRSGNREIDKKVLVDYISNQIKMPKNDFERKYGAFFKKDQCTIAIGKEGFKGYFAFIYDESLYVIMEKFKHGNATYIFLKDEWENLSKLTKTELIKNKLYIKRISHNENWNEKVLKYFS